MHRPFSLRAVRVPLLLATTLLVLAVPSRGQALSTLIEQAARPILDQIDDFAIDSCDPPCEGLICCDNHVCVHSVLACGFFPILIDSFRVEASTGAQMAGFATQGVLAAEHGREARVWFGQLDGARWRELGIRPGTYELVLEAGATTDGARVHIKDSDGETVARLGGHYWKFYGALDNYEPAEWDLGANRISVRSCHDRQCVQLDIELS